MCTTPVTTCTFDVRGLHGLLFQPPYLFMFTDQPHGMAASTLVRGYLTIEPRAQWQWSARLKSVMLTEAYLYYFYNMCFVYNLSRVF